jgi:hypothetical protein
MKRAAFQVELYPRTPRATPTLVGSDNESLSHLVFYTSIGRFTGGKGTKKEIWEIKIIFKKPESGQIKQFIINVRHRTDSKTLFH